MAASLCSVLRPRPFCVSASADPATLPVFVRYGFALLENERLRATAGRTISLERAAALHGVDARELVQELNRAAQRE